MGNEARQGYIPPSTPFTKLRFSPKMLHVVPPYSGAGGWGAPSPGSRGLCILLRSFVVVLIIPRYYVLLRFSATKALRVNKFPNSKSDF